MTINTDYKILKIDHVKYTIFSFLNISIFIVTNNQTNKAEADNKFAEKI